ncbi:MAG: YrhK family protein [Pseudomonadota bacterium]
MFNAHLFTATPRHQVVYGRYERIYTLIDFTAAWLFIAGSIMFFSDAWVETGTWLFLIGSICFAARPTVRVLREHHLSRLPLPEDDKG